MEPLEVHVKISVDDETLELRAKAAELQELLVDAKRQLDALEFRYRCECVVNAELVDLCRANRAPHTAIVPARRTGQPGRVAPLHGGAGPGTVTYSAGAIRRAQPST